MSCLNDQHAGKLETVLWLKTKILTAGLGLVFNINVVIYRQTQELEASIV
jgi:hypothetical protein